jgi:hypothetical protein
MLSNLLDKYGIKYDDMNALERETFDSWSKSLASKQLTLTDVETHVKSLIEAVNKDLADLKESTSFWTYLYQWKRDTYLKARLRNYMMLYDFLTAPAKARQFIEQSLQNIK